MIGDVVVVVDVTAATVVVVAGASVVVVPTGATVVVGPDVVGGPVGSSVVVVLCWVGSGVPVLVPQATRASVARMTTIRRIAGPFSMTILSPMRRIPDAVWVTRESPGVFSQRELWLTDTRFDYRKTSSPTSSSAKVTRWYFSMPSGGARPTGYRSWKHQPESAVPTVATSEHSSSWARSAAIGSFSAGMPTSLSGGRGSTQGLQTRRSAPNALEVRYLRTLLILRICEGSLIGSVQ